MEPCEAGGAWRNPPIPRRFKRLERLTKPVEQECRTDFDAGDREERLMDIGTSFIANPKPPVLVDPAQRPLHHPAEHPQPAPILGVLLGQKRIDAELMKARAVRLRIVGPVPHQGPRAPPRVAPLPPHPPKGVEPWA